NHRPACGSPAYSGSVFRVRLIGAVMGCTPPVLLLAVNSGCPLKAMDQSEAVLLFRSNFQTLPLRSPAYAAVTLPVLSSTSPGVARPLSPATPVSILRITAPVAKLNTYNTAF